MLGAIIGDVAGSYYEVLEIQEKIKNRRYRDYEERIKILDKEVPLFDSNSSCTDDSILTCAIYDAIVNGCYDYDSYLREYGEREIELGVDQYGRSRFGSRFTEWVEGRVPGDSFGNGAAMRVSPVGFLFDTLEEVKENAFLSSVPTHANSDAIKCAEAVAVSIFLLRNGKSKEEVEQYVIENYFPLDYDLEELQRNYSFSSQATRSVPQALFVFFQSTDFEDSIRKAISIGGDSDTIAAIVGSLSEACYGVPDDLREQVKPYLKDYMLPLLKDRYYSNNAKNKKDKN